MSKRTADTPSPSGARGEAAPRFRRGAKALIASSDRVLLVRERHADGSPFWTLPGGGVRAGESEPDGLRRELREELDCRCLVGERVDEFWYCHSTLQDTVSAYGVYDCRLLSEPTPVPAEGVEGSRWVLPDDPPPATICGARQLLRAAGP